MHMLHPLIYHRVTSMPFRIGRLSDQQGILAEAFK